MNESSSFIPSIAMVSRFRGPEVLFFFAVLVLPFLILSLLTLAGRPERVEAQVECPSPMDGSPTVKASSRTPAANTSYEVKFVTPTAIAPRFDGIVMELHEDILVPRGIAPNFVRVQYEVQDDNNGRANGFAAFVELDEQDDPRHPTTVRIFHGIVKNNSPDTIPAEAKVTVTFRKGAGISNPTEGGAFSWKVGVGNDDNLVDANHPEPDEGEPDVRTAFCEASAGGEGADVGLLVDREIQLSHEEISRGDSITVIARGFKNGHTLTVWRDANVNGMRETGESELCQVEVAGNDIGYCNFNVHSPPFEKGTGMCPDGKNGSDGEFDCNFINAVDGLGGSTIILGKGSDDIHEANQLLELVGRIEADIVQGPGGDIQVQVFDFPEGVITGVTIGGVPAEVDQLRIGSSGRLHFSVPVPDNVRLGRQYLRVEVDRDDGMKPDPYSREVIVDISQPKAIVRIFPETVLANQRVSLSGLGFHDERGTKIDEVQFGGFTLKPSRVNGGTGAIDVAGDGNWNGSVDLPIVEATTSEGTHTLRVKDSRGRTGSVEVTVPSREVTVTPIWGRPGTTIKVTGTGFPSRNDHGSSVNLRIYYDAGDRFTVNSAEPDANGNFSREIFIPLNTPTPSSNFVRVEFDDDNGITVVTSAPHEVPGPVVQLSPNAGPPGTRFTMRGTGFRTHIPVYQVEFADINIFPGHPVSTDANGEFEVELMAPGLDAGQQTVRTTVAGVTASATFDIKPSGVAAGASMTVAEALERLGDRLLRVFHFNNDAKVWAFYAPAVPVDSTLELMVEGETYLVLVSGTTQAILNGESRSLTCHQGNCWNQIVW
ncbi:MAG: hypothetical protein OXR67_14100 [Chloroflexota bacterium]|nr:hypothetical protein [Chloroflexota bacterium]